MALRNPQKIESSFMM